MKQTAGSSIPIDASQIVKTTPVQPVPVDVSVLNFTNMLAEFGNEPATATKITDEQQQKIPAVSLPKIQDGPDNGAAVFWTAANSKPLPDISLAESNAAQPDISTTADPAVESPISPLVFAPETQAIAPEMPFSLAAAMPSATPKTDVQHITNVVAQRAEPLVSIAADGAAKPDTGASGIAGSSIIRADGQTRAASIDAPETKLLPAQTILQKPGARVDRGSSDHREKPVIAAKTPQISGASIIAAQNAPTATAGLTALPEPSIWAEPAGFITAVESPRDHVVGSLMAKSSPMLQGTHANDAAKNIAQQMVVKISGNREPRIELRLDPPELGRVTITMSHSENMLHAVISTERPEIAELMRRHADILSAAFEKAGFGQAGFEFQSDTQGSDTQNAQDQTPNAAGIGADIAAEASYDLTYSPGDTLDIRL